MKPTKLPIRVLKRSVLNNVSTRQTIGDGAYSDDFCTISTVNTRYGFEYLEVDLARVVNNLLAKGSTPHGITADVMLPRGFAESHLRYVIKKIDSFCVDHNIVYMGGNTDVCAGLKDIIVCITAVGKPQTVGRKAVPGDSIVIAGDVASFAGDYLRLRFGSEFARFYSLDYLDGLITSGDYTAFDIREAIKLPVVMQDLSSGGVFGGLYELADHIGFGFEAEIENIPIGQRIIEICDRIMINPYTVDSVGAMLIVTDSPKEVLIDLQDKGIMCSVIGHVTKEKDRAVSYKGEKRCLNELMYDGLSEILYK